VDKGRSEATAALEMVDVESSPGSPSPEIGILDTGADGFD
jgi:hypothetical protein